MIVKELLDAGLLDGDAITCTGETLAAQVRRLSGHTFDKLAADGVVVAYPESFEGGLWNDARTGTRSHARDVGVDDVSWLRALAAHLRTAYDVAPARVYAVGFSNGGQMVIRVIHEAPDLIAGAAVIGSCPPTPDNTLPEIAGLDRHQPMPFLSVHGTKDPIVPFKGGVASLWGFRPRGTVLSAHATARYFAARNGIDAEPLSQRVETGRLAVTVTRYRAEGCAPVDFHAVEKGGHTIPNRDHRAPLILGRTARDLDAGELVADFFGLR